MTVGDPGVGVGGGAAPTAVAHSYLASFATADPDTVAAHVAEGFVNDHASALGRRSVGRDEYRRRLPEFIASLAELRYEIEQTIADGPDVVVCYRLRARRDDHHIDVRGAMVLHVDAGLITRRTDYWDGLTFLRQTETSSSSRSPATP